jgi:hypothetical protein
MQAIRYPVIEPIMRLSIALQSLIWIMNWQSHLSGLNHLANRLGFGKYVTHGQLNHVSLLSVTNPPGKIDRGNLAMFRWNATDALSQVHVPVLLLALQAQMATVRRGREPHGHARVRQSLQCCCGRLRASSTASFRENVAQIGQGRAR